jgi:hypothetical protein
VRRRRWSLSFDHRQVNLSDTAASDLLTQPRSGLGSSCEEHHTCHRPIQPVNKTQKHIARFLMPLFDPLLGKIEHTDVTALIALNKKSGRLVYNEQMIVAVENRPAVMKKF